ncbi:MAG: YicC family protein [Gammaproteobacteria bacterium]|nr:YicC family protein [Gammaproteobacteria bacterium]MBQ0839093.1 YicC family protein [Gammaproteobacteria bacterium]
MPKSMTAFASASAKYPWGTLTWELRSINHRFLEATFRLPETLRHLEINYRENLRQFVQRGKVDCALRIDLAQGRSAGINLDVARQYLDACKDIQQLMHGSSAPLSPVDVLQVPGVMQEDKVDTQALQAATLEIYDEALQKLIAARGREGDRLSAFIGERLEKISLEVSKIRAVLPQLMAQQQQKLRDKLGQVAAQLDEERLEQELVYLANKSDADEELDRLETHIEEFYRALDSTSPVGRRLDFLLQELNREANTLSSKSQAATTTHSAVELKVLIEQIREQVQNLE